MPQHVRGDAPLLVRAATEADLPGVLAIYNHAVAHTTAIWNDVLVDLDNRRAWWRGRVEAGFPVLVAVAGGADRAADRAEPVLGYASYGPFRAFDGYRLTVEHSVYVAEGARRRGVATALLRALEREARSAGLHVMVGGVAADNEPSLRLHARLGFVETGRMPEVGTKFGRWLDLVLMQKVL
ncbi:GNAT family N-acetyltransferase [Propylenella binzhouense]|uniref:N-acetyltransferase family protein n=1 Tax=Propylenella binzhouense TaxID=2555902 RepID=A0A964T3T7_9HYPH|nr:GNAT family N-acetyltransferase [Propylenella binzhouense]MYZ47971.1 N-acetyltransferase family protein [Propylenella binzhouense]